MSNYTKTVNFATKDNLSPGNPLKIVKGTEIDTEYNNIATAVATKTDNSAAAITGGSITGITDLAVADGGTGASTAAGALNNLLPSQTSAANKYLQSDGTNASWDAVSLSTADITGTLGVANGGTGVTTSTGTTNVVLSNSPTLVTPNLGTPSALVGTNITGTASGLTAGNVTTNANLTGGVTSVGNAATVVTNANLTGAVTSVGNATSLGSFTSANLLAALTDETGTGSAVFATSPTLVTPALGTPSSATLTNATGLPISTGVSGLGTGVATFLGTPSSANLLAAVSDETGTGALVFATSPTLVTPALGTPSALVGTNITGTASGLTAGNVTTNANLTGAITSVGNATSLGSFTSANLLAALTDETGTGANVFATSPTLVTPILGTPTSATLTNATGLPLTTGVTGQLPVANGGTGTATPSIVAGTNVTVTGTWPNQTIAASGGGGGSPGGSTTQVQYNNAGAFGGITGATTNGTALTLVAPVLGTPASATLTNATGLPISTGVSGLGTGIATALAVNTGSSGAPVINGGALGTPTSGTVTNLTGTASININGTVGATTPASGAFTGVNTPNTFGFKNRIINGDMRIDQRNAGASIASPSDNYTTDRFYSRQVGGGVASAQQSSTAPTGFTNSLLFTVTTADSSIVTTDRYYVAQFIEGNNIVDLAFGTASASSITLSFWVRSSLTGTFGGAIRNSPATRSYPFTYTINAANTFEQKTITIAGDTSGTWATTNATGMQVVFSLGMGPDYLATAGAWTGGDYLSATGATNVIATNTATFYITGVQLEKGSTATSFDMRPYGTEFSLCQRYYNNMVVGDSVGFLGFADNSTTSLHAFQYPVQMRTSPTLVTTGTAANYNLRIAGGTVTLSSVPSMAGGAEVNSTMARINCSVSSGLTAGQGLWLGATSTTKNLAFSSEL